MHFKTTCFHIFSFLNSNYYSPSVAQLAMISVVEIHFDVLEEQFYAKFCR